MGPQTEPSARSLRRLGLPSRMVSPGTPRAHLPNFSSSAIIDHRHSLTPYISIRTCFLNSYAVPAEVGKVGVESPTFIEPVQKRKDGIEAMFMRQTKAKESTTTSAAAAVGSGKRKHEPSPPSHAGAAAATAPSSSSSPSPAKRAKAEKDPIKPKEIVDVVLVLDTGDPAAAEGHNSSDVEILSSPGPYSSQSVIIVVPPPPFFFFLSHPFLPLSLSHACVNFFAKVAAKPGAQKHEQYDTPIMSGSQQQQQQVSHARTLSSSSQTRHSIVPYHQCHRSLPYPSFTVLFLPNGY
jgi:hypothetical protein